MHSIDQLPQIKVTPLALEQWQLILDHDYTLNNQMSLRVQIAGKGCDGFTYAIGFDEKKAQDVTVPIAVSGNQAHASRQFSPRSLELILDAFSAFYIRNATLDYEQNYETQEEGFFLVNHDQAKYTGKFWQGHDELIFQNLSNLPAE